ncbi:MAG: threonine-phosphate decarboxylase CobD [Candidatus Thiothrix putei]|uniref:threonine-phosphate decarboxylase n=1 Tax=Candidatus Thiothrix putei TaxID=3080811 RepID=A0AA95KQS5_9GAMM|nr:MAG: threonine-phosphate decarboxylase CobD [Candidatus Thiothrix putei]
MFSSHEHGGQLRAASRTFGIPLKNWLDLSTGISPWPYPLSPVPPECWQRLPETDDGLESIAARYYDHTAPENLLPVAGTQQAIRLLPTVLGGNKRVGILSPAYRSHYQAWQAAGHQVQEIAPDTVEAHLPQLDVLVVVNPTNPTARYYDADILWNWLLALRRHDGWLVVDEAFMDAWDDSLIRFWKTPPQQLVVLRSLGKFFGLAGVRLGFVWAKPEWLQQLAALQDDWSVSHPARWAGKQALADAAWQQQQTIRLVKASARLQRLLAKHYGVAVSSTQLFAYVPLPAAQQEFVRLAQLGILVRLFQHPPALRFGLPASESQWRRLKQGIQSCPH